MDNFKKTAKQLEKFGLSENQTLIYSSLVQHGSLRIQKIADLTGIPRSSVYESLRALFGMGLVEKIINQSFVRIKPYPVGVLRHRLNEKLLRIQALIADLDSLESTITLLSKAGAPLATAVRYYQDVSGARQLFWNTLNAKNTVYVYSAFGRSKFVGKKFYMDFVKESRERGVKERVLINPTARAINLIKKDTGSSLARTKVKDIRVLRQENLLIRGETFIYDNIYAQVYLDTGGVNGFEIESRSFTETQKSIFETLWKMAKPILSLL